MWLRRLFARKIDVPRQALNLAYAEWDLRNDADLLGWDCIAEFIAGLENSDEFYRLTVYPYSRGRYALRADPRDWDHYENVYGRHLMLIRIKRASAALSRLLRQYDHCADGIIADNHDPRLFHDPIELEPGFAIAADEAVVVTGHDCDFIAVLRPV